MPDRVFEVADCLLSTRPEQEAHSDSRLVTTVSSRRAGQGRQPPFRRRDVPEHLNNYSQRPCKDRVHLRHPERDIVSDYNCRRPERTLSKRRMRPIHKLPYLRGRHIRANARRIEQLREIKPPLTFFGIQVGVQVLKCDKTACLGEHSLPEAIDHMANRHAYRTSQEETTMRLSTEVIPRADHTARSTSSRAAHEPTVPVRITALSSTTTLTRPMSM